LRLEAYLKGTGINLRDSLNNFEDLGSSLTLKDKVIDSIRCQIMLGNLRYGTHLREGKLSKAMNVSRAPIREAFNQLENEGFVKIIPRKGVMVSPISEQFIEDVFEVNSILETAAFEKSLAKIPHCELETIERIFDEFLSQSAMEDRRLEFLELNKLLHFTMVKYCGNQVLLDYWGKLQDLIHWFRSIATNSPDFRASAAIHIEIIDAIRKNDLDLATNKLNAHREEAKSNALRDFRKINDD